MKNCMKRMISFGAALLLVLGMAANIALPAQAADKLPSEVLDLTNWKLTLPINKAEEVKQPALDGYEHEKYFHVNESGDGVVFMAPVEGETTSGSGYPRSELREMTNGGKDKASWSTGSGTHIMEITQAITHTPDVKKHVVVGQIHDGDDDVIVFRLEGTKLFIDENGNDGPVLTKNYELGTVFTVKFVAGNGGVMCFYNGEYVYTYQVETSGCYFKAGMYTQSNLSKGDEAGAYGEAVIYGLEVEHLDSDPEHYSHYEGIGTEAPEVTQPEVTDPTVPSQPVAPPVVSGGYIHNFTDDGFASDFYAFNGSKITNGKHGTYTYDFGTGTETLNHALKFDSGGSAVFTPTADGTVTIAVAAQSAGRKVVIAQGSSNVGEVNIDTANKLFVLTVDVSANVTYTVKRSSGEAGLYYIAYVPAVVHTHSYSAVVTAPTCTAQGCTTYTCSCGDTYDSDYVAANGHNYANGVCTVCGTADPNYVALFNLAGANVDLGNSLTMNFYVNASDIQGTNYYIEMVKSYGDGTSVTTQIPYAQWESYFGVMWMVKLEGMAAKEMADKIEVTVYTTAGVQVSNTWTDSIRDYCVRQLNNASQSAAYTLLVDMLNYGAAAQINFSYNTGDLANSTLTAAQKNYATKNFNMGNYTNNMVVGTNFIGSSLSLETNIVLSMYFMKPASSNGLVAKISYIDHLGVQQTYEVAEADFLTLGNLYGVAVDTLVASDVRQVVTLEVYDGSNVVVYGADSMESYAVRQGGDINTALMIFTLSAYDYLH